MGADCYGKLREPDATACIPASAQVTREANWLDGFGPAGGTSDNGEGE